MVEIWLKYFLSELWLLYKIPVVCVVAEKLSGEGAEVVADMLQEVQVNSKERDTAVRLLKTGGLEAQVSEYSPQVCQLKPVSFI